MMDRQSIWQEITRSGSMLDITTAISDLQAIGVEFTQEYLDAVKRSEEERLCKDLSHFTTSDGKGKEWSDLFTVP